MQIVHLSPPRKPRLFLGVTDRQTTRKPGNWPPYSPSRVAEIADRLTMRLPLIIRSQGFSNHMPQSGVQLSAALASWAVRPGNLFHDAFIKLAHSRQAIGRPERSG